MENRRNQQNNREISDLERARRLREEADFLENRERVKSRLKQLMNLSRDAYYDQYLAQMWKDLESGKATPAQVEQEAQRSYLQYQRHMACREPAPPKPEPSRKGNFSKAEPDTEFAAKVNHSAIERQGITLSMQLSEPCRQDVDPVPAGANESMSVVQESTPVKAEEMPAEAAGTEIMPGNISPDSERSAWPERARKEALPPEKGLSGNTLEFKVGVHVFGIIGALFVLAAFVIFGYHFLKGLGQGLCLYGAALVLIICSELLGMRKSQRSFSGIVTGIGVGGLYIANIVNYLVLHTINGIEAMLVAVVVGMAAIFLGRKKNSAWIRIISLIGFYLCLFPVKGFASELYFLVIAVMLLVVNTAGVFFRNQSHKAAINVVHMILNTVFTALLVGKAWTEEFSPVYLVFFIATAFIFVSVLSLKECMKERAMPFALCCLGNGILLFILFLVGNLQPQVTTRPELALFVHMTAEILILTICLVTFMLWEKEDGRKWAQLYYGAGVILLSGSFSKYHLEIIVSVLAAFLVVKLFATQKEVLLLDCIAVTWVGIAGIWLSDYWYCWLFAAALFLSIFRIKQAYLYHEITITASILLIWWSQCRFLFYEELGLNWGWFYPVSAGVLLVLFLLFNHLPGLKGKKQQPYNIASLVVMSLYYLMVWFWYSYVFSSIMMVLGAVTILIVFRKRYELEIPRKYLVLAGFLTYFSLTGHYESPVIVSILLMIIALVCVGIGFKQQDKVERISGLVMAIIVCLKLVLYDFREVEVMYRMLVFLVVGVIALVISFIYVKLEKCADHTKAEHLKIKERSQNAFDVVE